ncbi:MAG: DUF898 family protein [Gammaproteobacteria bacterium]|nr:DUF898 family protein [Gammaproteobacteria bacterium]
MENNNFEIYYRDGLKSGVSSEEATEKLSQLLKVSLKKAELMIASADRVVKSGLSKKKADKYYAALSRVGLQVEIQKTRPQKVMEQEDVTEPTVPEVEDYTPQCVNSVSNRTHYDHAVGAKKSIQLIFKGKGFEYFKIWIVNIFLTILTLGIYSAWAKVRNKQYFYGNTFIDGNSFNYTAKPLAILKGRLIAVGLFIMYAVLNQFMPIVGLILFLLLLAFLPWIIIRSLAFNARNSVFRNIRFNFTGTSWDAVKAFLLWPLLMLPTLGLILPFVWYKQSRFFVNNSAYGTTGFHIDATVKDYYKIFLIFLGSIILLGVAMSVLIAAFGVDPNNPAAMMPVLAVTGPLSLLVYLYMFGYLAAALGNLYFNTTTLDQHGFMSTLKTRNIAWIYFSNTLAIAFSFGLLIPWAQLRMTAYRVSCLQLKVADSLDDFIAAEEEHVSALGEQVGEIFDMEVSVI